MEFDTVNFKNSALVCVKSFKQFLYKSSLVFSSCDLCGNKCQEHLLLCDYCLHDLPKFNYKLISADLLNWPTINKIIPVQSFDHLHSLSPHTWPYSQWIGSLKYNGRFELAELLGRLLYNSWEKSINELNINQQEPVPELVLPVPLHITKWQYRGYNQAHLIAKKFAKHSEIKYRSNMISRISDTAPQVGKSGVERRKSIKNAFSMTNKVIKLPKHVILIDDVVTTGTTVNQVSALLKKNGVEKITVLSITISLPEAI